MTITDEAQQNPVNDTQDAAMPTADQQTTNVVTSGTDAPKEVTVQDKDTSGLPDEVKDRTKREFEKIKDQLREERVRREYLEASFQAMQTPHPDPTPFVDPITGFVNEQALAEVQQRAQTADERAKRAEATVQQYMYQQEERDAYQAHPELKDKTFMNQARGIMYDSQVNPQEYGKQLSIKEAADYLKSLTAPVTEQAKAEGSKEALEQITPKEQASFAAEGSRGVSDSGDDLEQLQYRSRRGDVDALAERLKNVPRK